MSEIEKQSSINCEAFRKQIPTNDLAYAAELLKDEKTTKLAVKKLGATLGREIVLPEVTDDPKSAELRLFTLALAIRDYGFAVAKATTNGPTD